MVLHMQALARPKNGALQRLRLLYALGLGLMVTAVLTSCARILCPPSPPRCVGRKTDSEDQRCAA